MDIKTNREQLTERLVDDLIKEQNETPTNPEGQFSVDVQDMSFKVATVVHDQLVEKGVPSEKIDMNTVIEILAQVISGYISYIKYETGNNIESHINEIIKMTTISFDSVYANHPKK